MFFNLLHAENAELLISLSLESPSNVTVSKLAQHSKADFSITSVVLGIIAVTIPAPKKQFRGIAASLFGNTIFVRLAHLLNEPSPSYLSLYSFSKTTSFNYLHSLNTYSPITSVSFGTMTLVTLVFSKHRASNFFTDAGNSST